MPIRPENRDRYPFDWSAIRARILFRAGERRGRWSIITEARCEWCGAENHRPHPETDSMVVITIAHLNHTPEDYADGSLAALCQLCHNRLDAPERARGRRQRQEEAAGVRELF